MKKSLIHLVLLGVITGVFLFLGYMYYQSREWAVEETSKIDSFSEFVSLIKFKNGEGLPKEYNNGFYYELKNSDTRYFEPKGFYKENEGKESVLRKKIRFFRRAMPLSGIEPLSEASFTETMKVHNLLLSNDGDSENTFKKTKDQLEVKFEKKEIKKDELTQLSYIYNIEGDYEWAEALDKINCKKNKERCETKVEISLEGVIKDSKGVGIVGVEVHLLNYPSKKPFITDASGNFKGVIHTKSLEKIRVRAKKKGYAAVYGDFYVVTDAKGQSRKVDLVMTESQGMVLVNTKTGEIRMGGVDGVVKSVGYKEGRFKIKTGKTSYLIPKNAFVDTYGKVYYGDVDISVFEFDRLTSGIDNLLRVDARSSEEEMMFQGSTLVTYGMPYLQIFARDTGKELFIDYENPAIIRVKISEMEALKEGGVTKEIMERLVSDSKRLGGFPITREYLVKNKIKGFPRWWMLDQKRGVWDTVPMKMIDVSGVGETWYYSIHLSGSKIRKKTRHIK